MIGRTALLVIEVVALLLGVSFFVHLFQRWLGADRLRRWMGGRPVVAASKGIAVGFLTPFCTYSAIPLLIGLRRAGVSPAGYVAFMVAAPVLDPILFGALVIIVGLEAALVYVAVALAAAYSLALLAERVGMARHLKPLVAVAPGVGPGHDETGGGAGEDREEAWRGSATEVRRAAAAALGLLRAFGPVLVVGVAIGLGIEALVPPEMAARLAGGQNVVAIPAAAALGTPLYFNTELFVPIADALAAVGVGTGAIVALTIAGAGANLPEFVILGRLARAKVLAVFVGYVFAVAVTGGVLAQAIAG